MAGVSRQIHRSATIYKTFTDDADIRITEIVIPDMGTLLPDDTQFVLLTALTSVEMTHR
jgi:hypothetical protein